MGNKLNTILKNIRKKTGSCSFAESKILKINGYIDTGSYAINRIISGNIYNGVPEGRIVTFYGPSQSGKSYVIAQIIKNAILKNKYDIVFYVDSEGGSLWSFLEDEGVDLNKIEHIPISSVEEGCIALLNIYKDLEEVNSGKKIKRGKNNKDVDEEDDEKENVEAEQKDNIKALVIIDSFKMVADKFITDATDKNKVVQDMGTTARLKNALMNSLMMKVMKTQSPLIIANHVYENPAAMFTSKIKDMPGGSGLVFASHVIIQTAKKLIKDDGDNDIIIDNEEVEAGGYYRGNTLKFFSVKNRIIKPGYEAEIYIDFSKGIGKWDGLIEDAKRLGFIKGGAAGRYEVPTYSDKKVKMSDLLTNDKIWESFIDEFNRKSAEEVSYSTRNKDKELDELIK